MRRTADQQPLTIRFRRRRPVLLDVQAAMGRRNTTRSDGAPAEVRSREARKMPVLPDRKARTPGAAAHRGVRCARRVVDAPSSAMIDDMVETMRGRKGSASPPPSRFRAPALRPRGARRGGTRRAASRHPVARRDHPMVEPLPGRAGLRLGGASRSPTCAAWCPGIRGAGARSDRGGGRSTKWPGLRGTRRPARVRPSQRRRLPRPHARSPSSPFYDEWERFLAESGAGARSAPPE